MNKANFLRIARHHLTALCAHTETQANRAAPKLTALGGRILELSLAYRTEFLSEEQLNFFSSELVKSCDAHAARVRGSVQNCEQQPYPYRLMKLLERYSELANSYDKLDHSQVVYEVNRLERSIRALLLSNALSPAA